MLSGGLNGKLQGCGAFLHGLAAQKRKSPCQGGGGTAWCAPFFDQIFMAYAVFQTGAKQYRVSVGDIIDVDLLDGEQGKELTFSNVLMLGEGSGLKIGQAVGSASVVAEVLEQYKGPKVIAYKYKRRKGYHRTVGFRRRLTKLKITSIGA